MTKNYIENENFTKIENAEQFFEIVNNQQAREVCTRMEVAELVQKFKADGKEYTILSHQDANDGSPWYLTYGIRCGNNIGYFVLEGNFTLPDDIDI